MRVFVFFMAVAAAMAVSGCNDNSQLYSWTDIPDTVTLASASRTSLTGLGSGYDITTRTPVVIERLGAGQSFDFAITDQGGQFFLTPAGAIYGASTRAGIDQTTRTELTSVTGAPSDSASYEQVSPVPAQTGVVYIIRSRRVSCFYTSGSYYAKMKVISMDPSMGTLEFEMVQNPNCGDLSLKPPG